MGEIILDTTGSNIPPSLWAGRCHRLEATVSENVHQYFLKNWKFRADKVREMFPKQGLATWHCCNYPDSLDDRIEPGAMLCTILFLVDDELEYMSLSEGTKLIDRVIGVVKQEFPPDPNVPVEWMMHEIWEKLREIDQQLTHEMIEPAVVFWRSQVAAERLRPQSLKSYLAYREADIASGFLLALQRFSMNLHIPQVDLLNATVIEKNYSNCISVINDVCSFDKEVLAAKNLHEEGGRICSAVQVVADEAHLPPDAAKGVLWTMVRGWEKNHERLVSDLEKEGKCSLGFLRYLEGVKLQLSGTELWSRTTLRYLI